MERRKNKENERNEFDEEMRELRQWQENQYNPGYYTGTGRIPKPVLNMARRPLLLILIGVINLIPVFIIFLAKEKINSQTIYELIPILFVPAIFIYGGIRRLLSNRKKGKKKNYK